MIKYVWELVFLFFATSAIAGTIAIQNSTTTIPTTAVTPTVAEINRIAGITDNLMTLLGAKQATITAASPLALSAGSLTLPGALALKNMSTALRAGVTPATLGLVIGTNTQAWSAYLDAIRAGTWTGAASITTVGTLSAGAVPWSLITNPPIGDGTDGNYGCSLKNNSASMSIFTGYSSAFGSIGGKPSFKYVATTYALVYSPATGVQTFITTPTSANLAAALTDETGSGAAVFGTSPTLATPMFNTTPTSGFTGSYITTSTLTASKWYTTNGGSWVLANNGGTPKVPAMCYTVSTTQCLYGGVIYSASHGFTVGAPLYLSTAGGMTTTAPSTSGYSIQRLGMAVDANIILLMVSPDVGTVQ